jgi:hypothetical protein
MASAGRGERPGGSSGSAALLHVVHHDAGSALRLVGGLLALGLVSGAAALPCCARALARSAAPAAVRALAPEAAAALAAALAGAGGPRAVTQLASAQAAAGGAKGALFVPVCALDWVAQAHWWLIVVCVALQVAQVPVRLLCLLDVVDLRARWPEPRHRRQPAAPERLALEAALEAVMSKRVWKANQWLSMTGQYLVPALGAALALAAGEGSLSVPGSLSSPGATAESEARSAVLARACGRGDRPGSCWNFLVLCALARALGTFVWGYLAGALAGELVLELQRCARVASEDQIAALPTFAFTEELGEAAATAAAANEDENENEAAAPEISRGTGVPGDAPGAQGVRRPSPSAPAAATTRAATAHGQTRCSICICEFERGERLALLPCNTKHVFHADCVFKWLRKSKACPLCMIDIDEPPASSHLKST